MRNNKRRVVFPQHHRVKVKTKATNKSSTYKSRYASQMDDTTVLDTVPFLLQPPIIKDELASPSSKLQDATISECLPLLNGLNNQLFSPFDYDARGIRQILSDSHIAFAEDNLAPFPSQFVTIDASRPWMLYWGLTALYLLGVDVSIYRHRVVKTFYSLQNPSGGYGGGQGHYSHLAATYAAILSLALVGGTEAYELTDRYAMWTWLGRLKQQDGGFQICDGGENDTRAAYCALLVVSLLDLPEELPAGSPARQSGLRSFKDGVGEYISRCQTYEGGIASSPGTEAHGAYTFCALAALCLLDAPHLALPKYLDLDAFVGWLSSRQYAPEGGFAGRTNKVVDGCYSHWLGDCFPLVQAALTCPVNSDEVKNVKNLYSTEGLARYILNCCQDPDGGLKDKPSKRPDSYHTCYTLAGLSAGEHIHYYTRVGDQLIAEAQDEASHHSTAFAWKVMSLSQMDQSNPTLPVTLQQSNYQGAINSDAYTEEDEHAGHDPEPPADFDFDSGSNLRAVHPVFVIPHHAVSNFRSWSLQQRKLA